MMLTLASADPSCSALSQPDGTPLPVGAGLQALFDSRGESIDALTDAAKVPETFTPDCGLSWEVLARRARRQAGSFAGSRTHPSG